MLDLEQQPPMVTEAIEAEQALLGAVILDPKQLDAVAEVIGAADFYDIELGKLFALMADLRQAGRQIGDMVVLVHELKKTDLLDRVIVGGITGTAALGKLAGKCQYPGNAPLYARQIKDCAVVRRVAAAAAVAWCRANAPAANGREIAEQTVADLEGVLAGESDESGDLTEVVEAETIAIEQCCEEGKSLGIPTGIGPVDELTGGFYPGELIILGARPSMGKTAWAFDTAVRVASRGFPVLFISLEMSRQQIAHRMLSRETGIPVKRMQKCDLTSQERAQLAVARDALRQLALPIRLWCTGDVTPARIAARARVQMAQTGLKLLVIDYLGLVSSNDRHKTIYERVSAVSREIKLISQTLNIPILLLAQLNREGAKSLPTLEHLRDSGSIEQDANSVWFLHREHRAARDCKLIVAKQRQGEVATVDMEFDGDSMTFNEHIGHSWQPG